MNWEPYLVAMLDEIAIDGWKLQTNALLTQLKSTQALLAMLKNTEITQHTAARLGAISGNCDKLINAAEETQLKIREILAAL